MTSLELLDSKQLAHFVAHGSLRMDAVVPAELNAVAIPALEAGIPVSPPGTPIPEAFAEGSFARELVDLPVVAGAIHSLVGPYATVDHHAVHIRPPRNGAAQPLHADAIIDTRMDAFDVQLMYYPHAVTLDMGGTLSVPGTHLRQINESDIGRYQNLRGQSRLTCPAGTVVFLHHGIWHGGRRNDTDVTRFMFKIRFNPTVKQRLLWDTADLADPQVPRILGTLFPWQENASGRLDVYQRVRLWRALTGDDTFDLNRWHTNTGNRPQRPAPTA